MTAEGAACSERALVDRHFAETIEPQDERRMREHLAVCQRCHKHYRRHLLLAQLDPDATGAEERIANGLGIRHGVRPKTSRIAVLPIAASVLAVAAVLFFVLRPPPRGDLGDPLFAARGSVTTSTAEGPEAIRVYRVPAKPGDALVLAPSSLKHDEELAFSYRSTGTKTHLMIFGVDERGQVYWFHPAWTNSTDTPAAVPIDSDGASHELREAIRHRFDGERLEIHGLFVDRPITVRDVEAAVRDHASGPLSITGAVDHVTTFGTAR